MAKRVQKRRGTPADHLTFTTGAAGEVTVELPTTRGSGSTQAYGALYVHHGDNAAGDRIAGETEIINKTRTTVDEQRFLARITGFRPLNDDSLTADPDIMPSKWEYRWEEVSLSGGFDDVAQVVTITLSSGASGAATKTVTLPKDIYGVTKDVNVTIGSGDSANDIASAIQSAIQSDSEVIYTATVSNNVVTLTGDVKGTLTTPTTTISDVATVAIAVTTKGTKLTAITDSSADLSRSSDPGSDGTHEFAAVNICELMNDSTFVGPGIGDGSTNIALQSASGPWPTNYKVVPVGGSGDYASNEPVTTANSSQTHRFRDTAVNYLVEMVERRKLDPGTADTKTVGSANSDGYNVFYYFQVPNAITGPC